MNLQPGECPSAKQDHQYCKCPEIQAEQRSFEKPAPVDQRIPVTGHDIVHRIHLENGGKHLPEMQIVKIPHDRRHPDTHLQTDGDDLCQIPEKDNDRAGQAGHPVGHDEHAERIIDQLYDRHTGEMPGDGVQDDNDTDKEQMDK